MRARPGVTLLELMVALTVLGVGLLALAGPAATLARHTRRSALDLDAAVLARDLGERLAATCPAPWMGDTTVGALHARWTVADDSGTRLLRLTVNDASGATSAERRFAARALCAAPAP